MQNKLEPVQNKLEPVQNKLEPVQKRTRRSPRVARGSSDTRPATPRSSPFLLFEAAYRRANDKANDKASLSEIDATWKALPRAEKQTYFAQAGVVQIETHRGSEQPNRMSRFLNAPFLLFEAAYRKANDKANDKASLSEIDAAWKALPQAERTTYFAQAKTERAQAKTEKAQAKTETHRGSEQPNRMSGGSCEWALP